MTQPRLWCCEQGSGSRRPLDPRANERLHHRLRTNMACRIAHSPMSMKVPKSAQYEVGSAAALLVSTSEILSCGDLLAKGGADGQAVSAGPGKRGELLFRSGPDG